MGNPFDDWVDAGCRDETETKSNDTASNVETLNARNGDRVERQATGIRAGELKSKMLPLSSIKPVLKSRYLVKGWLDRGTFSVVFGDSNVGKTFFALDIAMHVVATTDWHGNRVSSAEKSAGRVVYIAGEGGSGIKNRIEAIRRERPDLMQQIKEGEQFVLLPTVLDLCGEGDAEALASAIEDVIGSAILVVIDTLARAFGGGDENTAKDMGAFIRNVDYLRSQTLGHVMVVHHSGKDASKGARGSGSLRAATDTEIELTQSGGVILAETKKQRDMPSGAVFAYTLKSVVLGLDEDGDEVTSAVVEATETPTKRKPNLSGQQMVAMKAFDDALSNHGVTKSGKSFPTSHLCVSLDHWREYCVRDGLTGGGSDSAKRQAFGRAKKILEEKGFLCILDGFAWRCAHE